MGRTGIKMQTQRMDLRTRGGESVSWDEVKEQHGHIYTTKCKIDSQWETAAQHSEISSVLCDHLEGWDREGGREGDARGRGYGDICIGIAYSLCYTAETNTTLQSNFTLIKMLKKKDVVHTHTHTHTHTEEYFTAIKRMKFCHLQQHRWTWRLSY